MFGTKFLFFPVGFNQKNDCFHYRAQAGLCSSVFPLSQGHRLANCTIKMPRSKFLLNENFTATV